MTLCPQCLAARIIAPASGPTCPHNRGADWWPQGWANWTEAARVEYLKANQFPKCPTK